jgi:hypothetical protein
VTCRPWQNGKAPYVGSAANLLQKGAKAMYKAIVTIASLLGSIGVFVGVEMLDSGSTGATTRTPNHDVIEMHPPALEPPTSVDFGDSQITQTNVITIEEVQVPRHPRKAVTPQPVSAPTRELQPCSDWEDVGPKALTNPDGTVEMRRARLLC